MAPAAASRRSGPGAPPRPRPGTGGSSRWLIAAGVGVLLLAAYLIYSRRTAAGAVDTSGTPGPDLTGSAAQQPNGGASSVPGSLPPLLVNQPDPVTAQVQQTDTSSSESPQAISGTSYGGQAAGPVQSVQIGQNIYQQSAPGSDYLVPLPKAHPGGNVSVLAEAPGSNIHRPGVQL